MNLNQKILWARCAVVLASIGLWQFCSGTGVIDPFFFGKPSSILLDLWSMIIDFSIFYHVWITFAEAMAGFFFLPLYVAHGQNMFQEQGLDVTIDSAQGGPLAMQALISGQVQFCATGHGQVANMWAKGKSTKIVNQMQDKCTFYLVGRPEINHIGDLSGKTIGCTKIGAETYGVGRYLVAGAGLDPEKDITMTGVGGMSTMASALENNRVQAVVSWQPLTSRLINQGKGNLLARLNTTPGSYTYFNSPSYSFSVIQVTDSFLAENPKTVQQFVNAMVKAEKWIASSSMVAVAKAVAPYFPGMDLKTIKESVIEDSGAFTQTGLVTKKGHDTAVTVFREAKILDRDVPFEAIVDNSFTQNALH
ncbi:MAG: ABC transporter substrate-binding protein [Pseudomonadota bacterium]